MKWIILLFYMLGMGLVEAKRAAPNIPPPISRHGIEYASMPDLPGCIQASDSATGRRIWWLQVYVIQYDPFLEKDVQDVHIDGLELVNGSLIVSNEIGYSYSVDLRSKSISVKKGKRVIFKTRAAE